MYHDTMTTTVTIEDAELHLRELMAQVEQGDEVVIEREGVPVAKIVGCATTAPERGPVEFGAWAGKGWVSDNFDAPLTASELAEWEDRPLLTS